MMRRRERLLRDLLIERESYRKEMENFRREFIELVNKEKADNMTEEEEMKLFKLQKKVDDLDRVMDITSLQIENMIKILRELKKKEVESEMKGKRIKLREEMEEDDEEEEEEDENIYLRLFMEERCKDRLLKRLELLKSENNEIERIKK